MAGDPTYWAAWIMPTACPPRASNHDAQRERLRDAFVVGSRDLREELAEFVRSHDYRITWRAALRPSSRPEACGLPHNRRTRPERRLIDVRERNPCVDQGLEAGHVDRNRAVCRRPVPELPGLVVAPALHPTIGRASAGVRAARRNRREESLGADRGGAVRRRPVPELAGAVQSPAEHPALSREGA